MMRSEEIKSLTLYTGSNGRKGCSCKCKGCSQKRYGMDHEYYQSSLEQIEEILSYLPNVERTIILGNPDPSVDPKFCNSVAKLLVSKGIRVRFSQSGYKALSTARIVLNGVDSSMVDYYSFSIDSVDEKKLQYLKGKRISLVDVDEAIEFLLKNGYRPKVQPTLREYNKKEYEDIFRYYIAQGVDWFSYHAGSYETNNGNEDFSTHITPIEWREIVNHLLNLSEKNNVSLHIPYIFLTENEFEDYSAVYGDACDLKSLLNTQIWIEEDTYRTTHCPLYAEINKFDYPLEDVDNPDVDYTLCSNGFCPVAAKALGHITASSSVQGDGQIYLDGDGEKLFTVCRFYDQKVNL